MLKSFLLSGLRHLKNNALFSFLNVLALSVALSSVFIILSFIINENSIDDFHRKSDQIHMVTLKQENENSSREVGLTTLKIANWLRDNASQVEDVLTVRRILGSTVLFTEENGATTESVTLAGENFFDFFDFNLINGNSETALSQPNSIVLDAGTAKALFGDLNPIGRSVEIKGAIPMSLQVTGVIKPTKKSHLKIASLISMDSRMPDGQSISDWFQYSVYNYVKVSDKVDSDRLISSINDPFLESFPESSDILKFYPLKEAYFGLFGVEFLIGFNTGNERSLMILMFVAILILTIAIVNYVNITISLSVRRVKEIGIRKVMGAGTRSLNIQFLLESTIIVVLSALIALTVSDLFVVYNSDLLSSTMSEEVFSQPKFISFILFSILGVILISFIYPSFFINRLGLISSLKNSVSAKGNKTLRNILLGVQFSITLGLLVMSLVVYQQQQFLHNRPVGFDRDQVLILPINNSQKAQRNYQVFKNELAQLPEVESISASTDVLGYGSTNTSYYVLKEGQTDAEKNGVLTTYFTTDESFISTYGLEIIRGRDFREDMASDSVAVIINEKLAEKLELQHPVNQKIKLYGDQDYKRNIIGVVKDFNFQSLHKPIEPAAFIISDRQKWNLSIRYDPAATSKIIETSRQLWQQVDPNTPYEYHELDGLLSDFYESERKFNTMISLFTIISIILSITGLFGLTAFSVSQSLKEISIRKVLGANPIGLLRLFSFRFLVIFLAALVVTYPVSIWLENKWLSNFAYKIDNTWWIYIVSMITIVAFILITVSITSLKAIISNPARYLRDE